MRSLVQIQLGPRGPAKGRSVGSFRRKLHIRENLTQLHVPGNVESCPASTPPTCRTRRRFTSSRLDAAAFTGLNARIAESLRPAFRGAVAYRLSLSVTFVFAVWLAVANVSIRSRIPTETSNQ